MSETYNETERDIIQVSHEHFDYIYKTKSEENIINNFGVYNQTNPVTGEKESWCEINFTICYESFEDTITYYNEILDYCDNVFTKINAGENLTNADLEPINETPYCQRKQMILRPDRNISEMYIFFVDFTKLLAKELQSEIDKYEKCKEFRQWCFERMLDQRMIRNNN